MPLDVISDYSRETIPLCSSDTVLGTRARERVPQVNLPSGKETAQAQPATTDGVHPGGQHHRAETTTTWKSERQTHSISNSQT